MNEIINRGIEYHRTKSVRSDLEKAFADEWELENRPVPGINYGHGTLQDLFISSLKTKPKLLLMKKELQQLLQFSG